MFKILFVDDDSTIGFIIRRYRLWESSSFYIGSFAANGKEALDLLANESFDLVITDIRMPMIDGLELIREMRKRGDKTCVLLASNYTDFKYAKEGLRLGALDFIEKPYTQEKLAEALNYAGPYLAPAQTRQIYEGLKQEGTDINQLLEMLEANSADEIEKMLKAVWKQIISDYPWVEAVENIDIYVKQDSPEQDIGAILSCFRSVIDKYELAHPSSTIFKVCRFMLEHLNEEQLIEKVSLDAGLSKDHLGRIFKAGTEMSLSEYATRLKVWQAKRLLVETNLKIYEISDRLGYATVDYFSRLFRNYTGLTPALYRKSER